MGVVLAAFGMNVDHLEPVLAVDLFPEMRLHLLQVLAVLTAEEWNRPTACEGWSVKDVALHILGDDIGLLSRQRDGFRSKSSISDWNELVAYVNEQNDLWVRATRRMSTQVLCAQLEITGNALYTFFKSLDPYAIGTPVQWVGPEPAPVWLEIAREYTEYWMHHQHICDALSITSLKEKRFFAPVLNTFTRALPRTFRNAPAQYQTLVKLIISGEAGGKWHLVYNDGWSLYRNTDLSPSSTVIMDAETAWRLFTKGIDPDVAARRSQIDGDQKLGLKIFDTVAIIA